MVDEQNVLIKQKDVDKNDYQLDKKCQEVPNKTTWAWFFKIVVKLEKITCHVLACKVYNWDKQEIKDCKKSKPCKCFRQYSRETKNSGLANIDHFHHEVQE